MRGTNFAELTAFIAIAERRSFAKAATQIGVSRSALSQSLRALEERLGVRLLHRTTRSVYPTEAGERLLARARPALEELTTSVAEVATFRDRPAGLLKLAVQPPVAALLIGPLLARFFEQHPAIGLDVSVVKIPDDIVGSGYDAGIRFGEQIERDMIAMRVTGEARFVVVASPAYLARHPAPKTPRDLQQHNCIRGRLPNGALFGWEFERKGKAVRVAVGGSLSTDDIDLVIRATLDGAGVGYILYDYVAPYIAKGQLVPLLEAWSPRLSGFYLYHSSRRQVTPALQAFIDFLKAEAKRRGLPQSAAPRATASPNFRLVRMGRR